MKVVALVSGGKDSFFNMMECLRYGHEVVVLANLAPEDTSVEELDSFMFQSAAHSAIETQAECIGTPLIRRAISGSANQQGMAYAKTAGDEVEDLFELLKDVKKRFPEVEGVSSGAIFSNYQRVRVENVCTRLGLTSLAFLWRRRQRMLMDAMLQEGLKAIVVKVCSIGLHPDKHLGKTLNELLPVFHDLHKRFEFHVCGEGGEYETLTLDCPLFKKRLVIDQSSVYRHSDDDYAPVALLTIETCHAEPKSAGGGSEASQTAQPPPPPAATASAASAAAAAPAAVELPALPRALPRPSEQYLSPDGSMLCLHGIRYETAAGVLAVEEETRVVMEAAGAALQANGFGYYDVAYVRLWLADMSLFPRVNSVYSKYFLEEEASGGGGGGVRNSSPGAPSRACVALPLTAQGVHGGAVRVMLDVWACAASVTRLDRRYWSDVRVDASVDSSADGSVAAKEEEGGDRGGWRLAHEQRAEGVLSGELTIQGMSELTPPPRSVLHVRSVSRWAPVCIGPYSQANVLRGCLVLLAGQIGLDPPSMELVRGAKKGKEEEEGAGVDSTAATAAGNGECALVDGFRAAAFSSDWEAQLHRAMLNNQRALRCLKSALHCSLGGVVYVSQKAWGEIGEEAAAAGGSTGGKGGAGGAPAATADLFRRRFESCLSQYPAAHRDRDYGSDDDQDDDDAGEGGAEGGDGGVGNGGQGASDQRIGAAASEQRIGAMSPGPALLFAVVPTLPKAADVELEFTALTELVVDRLVLEPMSAVDGRSAGAATSEGGSSAPITAAEQAAKATKVAEALAEIKYPFAGSVGQSIGVDPSLTSPAGRGDDLDPSTEFGAATQWHFRCVPRCVMTGAVLVSARLPVGVPLDSEAATTGDAAAVPLPMDKRLLQSMAQSLLAEEAIDLIATHFHQFGGAGSAAGDNGAAALAATVAAAAAADAAIDSIDADCEVDYGHDFSRAELVRFYQKEDPAKIPMVEKIMQVCV
jgi:uncharacterized protein (TIGR00290 family)